MPDMIEIIKLAALDAIKASNPVDFKYGEVISISPLSIKINQRMILDENQLILTTSVSDFETDVELLCVLKNGADDRILENVKVDKMKIKLGLCVGEKVLLLRVDNGEKYVILDRVR